MAYILGIRRHPLFRNNHHPLEEANPQCSRYHCWPYNNLRLSALSYSGCKKDEYEVCVIVLRPPPPTESTAHSVRHAIILLCTLSIAKKAKGIGKAGQAIPWIGGANA